MSNMNGELKRSVVVLYPLFVYFLAIVLPENFLHGMPLLSSWVNYLEQYIPALKGIGLRGKYPDFFQVLYLLHLPAIFLLIVVAKKTDCIRQKDIKYSNKIWPYISCLLLILLLIWFLFFYMFSEGFGDGVTKSAQASKSIRDSKLGFSLWTGVGVTTLSIFFLGFFLLIKKQFKQFLNNK